MYDFIMRLRPEYEQSRSQLLHSPSAYTLDEAFAIVLAEETRLRASSSGTGSALAAHRFAPPASSTATDLPASAATTESTRPPAR